MDLELIPCRIRNQNLKYVRGYLGVQKGSHGRTLQVCRLKGQFLASDFLSSGAQISSQKLFRFFVVVFIC
jgi:hypothetical protein